MTVSRESIYAALFALVSSIVDSKGELLLKSSGRREPPWTAIPGPDQTPALYQVQGKEKAEIKVLGMPAKWILTPNLVVMTSVGQDQRAIPSQLMNPVLDALEKLMPPFSRPGSQTLGGLVYDCRIEGEIWVNEGNLGTRSVALVPVRIVGL